MKKNCTGCRALVHQAGSQTGTKCCQLGYATKDGMQLYGVTVTTIPLEECPKPKTNSDYIFCLNNNRKN